MKIHAHCVLKLIAAFLTILRFLLILTVVKLEHKRTKGFNRILNIRDLLFIKDKKQIMY